MSSGGKKAASDRRVKTGHEEWDLLTGVSFARIGDAESMSHQGDGAARDKSHIPAPLESEGAGLTLESWVGNASSVLRKAMLPLVIACSPVRAFSRRSSLENVLTISPVTVFLWTLAWYVVLLVVFGGIRCSLDKLQGMRLVIGGYWDHPDGFRFGSVRFLPAHIVLAWMQCLFVTLIGMFVAVRGLTVRQVVKLATWLLVFTLIAGLLDLLFGLLWDRVLVWQVFKLPGEFAMSVHDAGNAATDRAHDIVLGFVAGTAVGTVLQRRRWLIAVVSAVVLALAFPIYAHVQLAYLHSVREPVRQLIAPEPPLSERISALPECLKIPSFELDVQYAFSRSAEEARSRGGLPTGVVVYLVDPMPHKATFLDAVRSHLGSLGWAPLKYDPLNIPHNMLTGDGVGWSDGVEGREMWDGWWVRDREAVMVIIEHGTPPGAIRTATSCNIMHYSEEAARDLLQPYFQAYGALPGDGPATFDQPDEEPDSEG